MPDDAKTMAISEGLYLVAGCGSIGKRHLGNLRQLGVTNLLAFDLREDRRQEVADHFGVPTIDSFEAAMARGPRVACICTPTRFHLEQALAAARCGCHLFVEKPVSESMQGVDELMDEVVRQGLVTLVGCNFRFHPGLEATKALLEEKAIGTVISARAQFGHYLPDWHPWEDYRQGYSARRDLGGGVILDRIHELDYLRWLLGDVARVAALAGHRSHLEIETEDTAEILFEFDSATYATVHLDYVRRTYECSLELIGDEGTILWSYPGHEVRYYRSSTGCWESRQWPKYDSNTMYLRQMAHFLRAVSGLEPSRQDVGEGLAVLRVALAVKEAARQGIWVRPGG